MRWLTIWTFTPVNFAESVAYFNKRSIKPIQKLVEEAGAQLSEGGEISSLATSKDSKDGFRKTLTAILVLLYGPSPHPLLCVEEPENQLYPSLLWDLEEEFRAHAMRGGQFFVSTRSPDFLNAVQLNEVFWLVREKGYTVVKRAEEDKQISAYIAEGDQMGYLWNEGLFHGVHPL